MNLFERFKKEKEVEKEIDCPVSNPLNLKFNSLIDIKIPEYYDISFKLDSIEEYKRNIYGKTYEFTDYILKASGVDNKDVVRLRLVDDEAIILKEYDSLPYSTDFNNLLLETENTGQFEIIDDATGKVTKSYGRLNNIKHSWGASVRKLVDADGNGIITKSDPVSEYGVKYWDFGCEVEEAGVKSTEFLVIEMNGESGWITLYIGYFVDLQSVFII